MAESKAAGRVENLRPFKPGQSGNPSGRPKAVLSRALRAEIDKLDGAAPDAPTKAERIAEKVVTLALDGNLEAIRLIYDRVEGKPRQSVTLTIDRAEKVERALEQLQAEARARGDELSRDEALGLLAEYMPEASELIN